MQGAADLLLQVYRWLPVAFFVDFLVVGLAIRLSMRKRRRHSRGESASP